MITKRHIYWFLNTIVIAFALGSLAFAVYSEDFSLFIGVWVFALFIYLAAFIMELLHLNIADLILRFADRFKHQDD